MSSKIPKYPGTEIEQKDLEAGKYLSTHYETVLRYSWTSGVAISRFLDGLRNQELWARKCNKCGRIMIPPRMYCEEDFRPTDEWVKVKDTGKVNTFSISYVNNDASRREKPILVAVIEIDGASPEMGILHLLDEVEPNEVAIGMKVQAVWRPESERKGAITDIAYFRPRR
ncbi:MAG: Zn-ribbon domain-containing OB-fold protein [Thaumarchaeota archaeon]|nr:Zn-ribbon domain-containing OB-fold protein [Nitrososphaerota archaeon]